MVVIKAAVNIRLVNQNRTASHSGAITRLVRTLEEEDASLKERNSAIEAKVAELEARLQLSAPTLVQYVPDAKPDSRCIFTGERADQAIAKVQATCRLIKASQRLQGLGKSERGPRSGSLPGPSLSACTVEEHTVTSDRKC